MIGLKEYIDNSNKLYALLWKSLFIIPESKNVLSKSVKMQLQNITVIEILTNLSPFSWNLIFQIIRRYKSNQQIPKSLTNNLNLMIWDSLFYLLEDQSYLEINDYETELILPKLQVKVTVDVEFKLLKNKNKAYILSSNKEVKLEDYTFNEFIIDPYKIKILPFINKNLIDDKSFEEYDFNLNKTDFVQSLSIALKIIESSDKNFFKDLVNEVKWFVPIYSDSEDTHRSYTSVTLPRSIFLSYTKSTVRLVEAIIHEYSHLILNRADLVNPLIGSSDKLFYSPWRDDPRPLLGLFHAIFVFSNVLAFYIKLKQNQILDQIFIAKRMKIIKERIEIGLRQIDESSLNQSGKDILDIIIKEFNTAKKHLDYSDDKILLLINSHMENWKNNNPALHII